MMRPRRLGATELPYEELREDKKRCRRFGPCGVGKRAIYVGSFYIERRYYAAFPDIERVFKRVAMSRGGFTGRGVFASLPYLVVEYGNGQQRQCLFKHEEQVDRLLDSIRAEHPELSTYSAEAERKLKEKERAMEEKAARIVSGKARNAVESLERAIRYLEKNAPLYTELSASARKKRTFDRSRPAYKWAALFITLMGLAAFIYGVWALITHADFGMYFLLFGLAAMFLFSSANVLPTVKNNRRYVERRLAAAQAEMERYLGAYRDFPVPACYAHPGVLRRMKEIILDGRADGTAQAFELMKEDLKALNSSVTVEQDEYEEIMAIKPMFLVMDYR